MKRFTLIELLVTISILSILAVLVIVAIKSDRQPTPALPTIKAESFHFNNDYRHLHRVETPFGWLVIRKDEMVHVLDPNHVWNPIEVESEK